MKRARKGIRAKDIGMQVVTDDGPLDEATAAEVFRGPVARAEKSCEPPIGRATMAPPGASPETAAKFAAAADSIDGWFNGYYAVRNLGRSLVTEATARMDHDPDRAVAMATAYVALLAADGRARA